MRKSDVMAKKAKKAQKKTAKAQKPVGKAVKAASKGAKKDLYGNAPKKTDIFCDIVAGRAPAYKIWEDHEYIAILDIFPNTPGVTLVIPKHHHESYAFDLRNRDLRKLMVASKKVARLLERKLGAKCVHFVLEGTGINHLHGKLYPAHGLKSKYDQMLAPETKFSAKYEGYVNTLQGPRAKDKDLKAMAKKLAEKR